MKLKESVKTLFAGVLIGTFLIIGLFAISWRNHQLEDYYQQKNDPIHHEKVVLVNKN